MSRAGLTPQTLTATNLATALDWIAVTLSVYHPEDAVDEVVEAIRALCSTADGDAST